MDTQHYDPTSDGALCAECPLQKHGIPVPSELRGKRLVLCGEAPGYDEEAEGRPFVGASGHLLSNFLKQEGYQRDRLSIVNALSCRSPKNISPADQKKAVACCKPRLDKELRALGQDLFIIAAGKVSILFLSGKKGSIFDLIGDPVECEYGTMLPVLHPAHVLRPDGRQWMPVWAEQMRRAFMLSCGALPPWEYQPYTLEPDAGATKYLKRILHEKLPTGFDVETMGTDPITDGCMCLSVANINCGVSVPWDGYDTKKYGYSPPLSAYPHGDEIRQLIKEILEDPKIPKIMQNGQHDDITMAKYDISINGFEYDTMLMHAIAMPPVKHRLMDIIGHYTHAPRHKNQFGADNDAKGAEKFIQEEPVNLRDINAKDSLILPHLLASLSTALDNLHRGWEQYWSLFERTLVAKKMRERGIPIDMDKFPAHIKTLTRKLAAPKRDLQMLWLLLQAEKLEVTDKARYHMNSRYRPRGTSKVKYVSHKLQIPLFNPQSTPQVRELFIGLLQAPILRRSELTEEASIGASELAAYETYSDGTIAEAAKLMLAYREWAKLLGYLKNERIGGKKEGVPIKNGIVHANWRTHGTRTGRWTSVLLTIPKPKKGVNLRNIFLGHGGNTVIEADYSQLELAVLALLAGDEGWLDIIAKGGDLHAGTARDMFGVPVDKPVPKQLRVWAKTFNFALLYGSGDENIMNTLNAKLKGAQRLKLSDVARMRGIWEHARPKLIAYMNAQKKFAYKHDYIEAPLSGRRYYFYGAVEPTKANPIQMTAADIINRAFPKIEKHLDYPREYFQFQVHDAVVIDTHRPDYIINMLRREMEQTITIGDHTATFKIDIKIGQNWGEATEEAAQKEGEA